MRLHRFFIAQPLGEEIVITDKDLLNQFVSVLRYKPADECVLFNGDGFEYTYIFHSLTKKDCILALKEKTKGIISKKDVTLILTLIKKDKLEWAIQKGTELGVSRFILTKGEHSEKKDVDERRLKIIAKEASEQCGRGNIPEILVASDLESAIEIAKGTVQVVASLRKQNKSAIPSNKPITLFIGPEGGWSQREEELFEKQGVYFISLGETVLRAETAAVVGAYKMLTC